MDPGPLRDVLVALVGVGSGALAGAFGVGGAMLSTPAIRVLGASAVLALGTTLPSLLPGALSGTLRYRREGVLDARVVGTAGPVGALTAVAGAAAVTAVPGDGHLLQLLTAGLLLWAAQQVGRSRPLRRGRPGTAGLVATGGVCGLLSGLLGIGAGAFLVAAFTGRLGLPVKVAIASSLACVGLFALPGTLTHALRGTIDWRFAVPLAIGVIPGARLGAAWSLRASDDRIRRLTRVLLSVLAVVYAAGELVAWWRG